MKYKQDYFGFVYLWFDTRHKKFIIGSHHGSINDGYTTSTGGVHVRRIFKVRPETMKRKILWYNPEDDIAKTRLVEKKYLDLRPNIANNDKYYNTKQEVYGGWEHVNNSPNHINPMFKPEVREKHSRRMKELALKNKDHFGPKYGDDNCMRRSEVSSRHPALFTKENNPMNDPAVRLKNKEVQTLLTGRSVNVKGVTYPSVREAARVIGCSPQKLRHRLKSDTFEDHFFIGG